MITFEEKFKDNLDSDGNGAMFLTKELYNEIQLTSVLEGLDMAAQVCDEHADYDTTSEGRVIESEIRDIMFRLENLYANPD